MVAPSQTSHLTMYVKLKCIFWHICQISNRKPTVKLFVVELWQGQTLQKASGFYICASRSTILNSAFQVFTMYNCCDIQKARERYWKCVHLIRRSIIAYTLDLNGCKVGHHNRYAVAVKIPAKLYASDIQKYNLYNCFARSNIASSVRLQLGMWHTCIHRVCGKLKHNILDNIVLNA